MTRQPETEAQRRTRIAAMHWIVKRQVAIHHVGHAVERHALWEQAIQLGAAFDATHHGVPWTWRP